MVIFLTILNKTLQNLTVQHKPVVYNRSMNAKRTFLSLAAQHGIEVEYSPGGLSGCYQLELTAPEGQVFRSSSSMFECSMMGWDSDGKHAPWDQLLPELRAIIAAGFDSDND